ncbi:39S ribosomal protein L44, mitochondrial [Melipona quadrifasciata]|uniref:Large ribosomal subunit protein mL44 n=1 Tax=Melipona quadrifasciata TaxID=166423 RepID=A0A0M8ZUX1_9HYME|nr:39S ribosomal protein L44, mitochondrial [Melipona quadrifasciata]
MNGLQLYFQSFLNIKHVNYGGYRYIKRWVSPTQKEITRRKKRLPPQPEPKRKVQNTRLSEKFDREKLDQAFTHKSYILDELKKQQEMGIEEPKLDISHNEEYIEKGREITSEVVKKYLNRSLPRLPEVGITALHDYLMSEEMLATASSHIGTKDIILTSVCIQFNYFTEHPVSQQTLAQTFVALVGALAESVNVDHAIGLANKDLTEIWCPTKPFKVLNDVISAERKMSIEARLIGQAGKNTILSAYHIGIYANKEYLGSGFGETIAEAKDVAAINILAQIYGLHHNTQPLRFNEELNVSA